LTYACTNSSCGRVTVAGGYHVSYCEACHRSVVELAEKGDLQQEAPDLPGVFGLSLGERLDEVEDSMRKAQRGVSGMIEYTGEMKLPDMSGYGQVEAIVANQLSQFTKGGWHLVCSWVQDEVRLSVTSYTDHSGCQRSATVPKVVSVRMFLVARPLSSVQADLSERVAALEADIEKTEAERKEEQKEIEKLRKDCEEQSRIRLSVVDEKDKVTREIGACRETVNKMERDFGKIRKAVGELRLKEILAAEG